MTRPRRSPLIRSARQASNAAKLSEIFGIKKPGVAPGILNFAATEAPTKAPVADLAAHHRPVNDHEFTC